jgi:hypothetical protein
MSVQLTDTLLNLAGGALAAVIGGLATYLAMIRHSANERKHERRVVATALMGELARVQAAMAELLSHSDAGNLALPLLTPTLDRIGDRLSVFRPAALQRILFAKGLLDHFRWLVQRRTGTSLEVTDADHKVVRDLATSMLAAVGQAIGALKKEGGQADEAEAAEAYRREQIHDLMESLVLTDDATGLSFPAYLEILSPNSLEPSYQPIEVAARDPDLRKLVRRQASGWRLQAFNEFVSKNRLES